MDGHEKGPDNDVEVVHLNDDPDENDIDEYMDDMDIQEGEVEDEDDVNGEAAGLDPVQDDAKLTFSQHKGSVFAVAINPKTGKHAVTGGEDDLAYVWSLEDGKVLSTCTGHKDSVVSVGYSADGKYIATADMGGLVKVWDATKLTEVWSFECSDIEWLQWHPVALVLLVGTTDGDVWMWKIPQGDTKTFQGHGCPSGVGKVLPDGKRLCCGYMDGKVKIWDLKSGNVLHNIKTTATTTDEGESVICMDCHHDNNLVLTGHTDVKARLIHANNGKVVATLDCSKADTNHENNTVESCCFCKEQNLAATGTLEGGVCVWDISSQTIRHTCKHQSGIVRMAWDPTNHFLLYTASIDGAVRLWDGRNGQCVKTWTGHQDSILDMDIARDGKFFVTVSDDGTARVFSPDS